VIKGVIQRRISKVFCLDINVLVFVRKKIKHGEGALSADEFKVSC